MVTLKVKGRSGQISEIQVEQLLEVDGRPFKVLPEDFRDLLIHQDGRLTAIESLIAGILATNQHNEAGHG